MPTFIAFLTPGRTTFPGDATPAELAVIDDHFRYLQDLLGRGVLVLAGRTDEPQPVGLVILECADLDTARGLVAADPAIRGGVFNARVALYRLALLRGGPGLSR